LQLSSLLPSFLVIVFYFMAYTAFLKDIKKNEPFLAAEKNLS
jgi:hypothetical protein